MKKVFASLVLLFAVCLGHVAAAEPRTFIYSVQGADTLRADFYPARTEKAPCVLFMFGGGFYTGSRSADGYSAFFDFLTERGYSVLSIDYRLGLKQMAERGDRPSLREMIALLSGSVDMAVTDLYHATAYLLDNSQELGIDSRQIIACGSSAGAISVLTGQWGLASGRAAGILPERFDYAAVISFAGAVYSTQGAPRDYAPHCPVLLFHGSADSNVPYDKLVLFKVGFFGSKYLAGRMDETGAPYYWCDFEGFDHKIATSPMRDNHMQIAWFLEKYVCQDARLQVRESIRDLDLPRAKGRIGIMDYIRSNFGGE